MAKRITGKENAFFGLTRVERTPQSSEYFDQSHFERELTQLWYRQWIYLCRADNLSQALSFRTFQIGRQRILVLRDDQGELRAFHNTCRHRGSLLCSEAEGRLKSKLLVCPYHRWSYRLNGELFKTSSLSHAEDFDTADFGLYKIALKVWRGQIFISLADEPQDFDAFLAQYGTERLANWPLETLTTAHVWRKRMKCNWKVFWENFNECLHCPNIHPELSDLVPLYSRGISNQLQDPNWQEAQASDDPRQTLRLRPGAETWSMDGQIQGEAFPDLSQAERQVGQSYLTALPSVYIACHADYLRLVRILPLGPEETELQAEWIFPQATLDDPGFDLAKVTDFAILVMQQDGAICEVNQEGLHALPHDRGVLMPEENYLHDFHQWVRAAMEAETR